MPFWKVLALSVLGFAIPVVVAVLVSPVFFRHVDSGSQYQRGWFKPTELVPGQELVEFSSTPDFADSGLSFRTIPSDKQLDPSDGKVFIANAVVRFEHLPVSGKRQRVFYKYAMATQPYPGWAFAVRRLPSSLRPEVYWQDGNGRGGWFTFGEISISEGVWYSFSFIVQNGDFLSLYWERLENETLDAANPRRGPSQAKFSGGFEITEMDSPSSDDPLFVAPGYAVGETAAVTVRQMLVAETDVAPFTMKSAIELVGGGAPAIASRLEKQQVRLWLADDGRDRSQFARNRSASVRTSS